MVNLPLPYVLSLGLSEMMLTILVTVCTCSKHSLELSTQYFSCI